ASRHAGYYRDVAGNGEGFEKARIGGNHAADEAEFGMELLGDGDGRVDAGEADGTCAGAANGGDELRIHRTCQHFQYGVDGFVVGDAEAAHKRTFHTAFFEEARHLLAAAMYDGHMHAGCRNRGDLGGDVGARGGIVQQTAADFDQGAHVTAAPPFLRIP